MIKLLVKWGFIQSIDTKVIARYLGGISKAVALGIIQTREEIEKEKAAGR